MVPGPEWLLASGLQLRVLHLLLRDLLPAVLLPGPEPAHHREAAEALPGLQVGAGLPSPPPPALSRHPAWARSGAGAPGRRSSRRGRPVTVMWSSRAGAGPGPPPARACAGRGQGQPLAQRRSSLWPDWSNPQSAAHQLCDLGEDRSRVGHCFLLIKGGRTKGAFKLVLGGGDADIQNMYGEAVTERGLRKELCPSGLLCWESKLFSPGLGCTQQPLQGGRCSGGCPAFGEAQSPSSPQRGGQSPASLWLGGPSQHGGLCGEDSPREAGR